MTTDAAIAVVDVSKRYRLYHERNQSLKASLMRRGRARYEDLWALRNVTLDVAQGKTYGLVGENGSGKSTLLKCMARILRPDGGRIDTFGKVSALLELGAGFHPELSGRENVFLNGAILGLSKKQIRERFDEIVDFAGLEQFIDSPVKNYSSGMYVRLGFSVAINVDPDILLIDEILAVGDAEFQAKCAEKFDDLRQRGKTVVIVSHALESIRNLCDEAAWLENGVLRAVGPTAHVIDEYLETTHHDLVRDGEHGARWGSGEARIDRIELLDPAGAPAVRVHTGEPVVFRLHYECAQRIEQPVFGLGLHRLDGVHVTGPNTREAGLVPEYIDGEGHVDLRVDRLLLLPGTYDVSATLFNYTLTHGYDSRVRALRFEVDPGTPRESYGVVSLGGSWECSTPNGSTGSTGSAGGAGNGIRVARPDEPAGETAEIPDGPHEEAQT